MKYDSVLWNDLINISPDQYFSNYDYLFDKEEYLSTKLKKYNLNAAKNDLNSGQELTPYHAFLAQAREAITGNITVYKLTNELIDVIQTITVDDVAEVPPISFKNPIIIETNDPKTNLFGDINSIVLYYKKLEGKDFDEFKTNYLASILFHTQPKDDINWYNKCLELNSFTQKQKALFLYTGANLFSLKQPTNFVWDFSKIDYNRNVLTRSEFCERCVSRNNCTNRPKAVTKNDYIFCHKGLLDNLFSFIIFFLYLLEIENSPIITDKKTEQTTYTVKKKGKIIDKKHDWYIKYLHLNTPKRNYESSSKVTTLNREDLISEKVWIKKHERNQACGKNLSERKLITIEPHCSSRKRKNNDTKIITSISPLCLD
ncbi:MAG: hypothetical protein FWC97_04800 [Treponema sp.]|nr:hypothetical protein [Treponema sp.]